MALKIRLRKQGRKNSPFYRLVVAERNSPRDGKYVEMLGWYNPIEKEAERVLQIKADRVLHWMEEGAEISEKAEALVKRAAPDVIKKIHDKKQAKLTKAREKKKARKAKAAA